MADLKIQQLDPLEGGALAALDDADLFIVKMKRRGTAIADEDRKVPWSQVKLNLSLGDYMPTIGGVFTGNIIMNNTIAVQGKNSANANRDLIKFGVGKTNANSVIVGSTVDALQFQSNAIPRYFDGSTAYDIITKKNLPAPSDINAYTKTEVDTALALKFNVAGGDVTGDINVANAKSLRWYNAAGTSIVSAYVSNLDELIFGNGALALKLRSSANPTIQVGLSGTVQTIYHTGNKPTAADVGTMTTAQITAADALKLSLTGGTVAGKVKFNNQVQMTTVTGATAQTPNTEATVFYSGTNALALGDIKQATLLNGYGDLSYKNETGTYTVYHTGDKPTPAEIGAATPSDVATAIASSFKNGGLMSASLYPDMLGNTTDFGVYYQTANANATLALGYPAGFAGSLLVTPSAYGCQQEYTTFNGVKYVRGLQGTFTPATPNWKPWVKQYGTASVPTPAEIGINTNAQNDARFAFSGVNSDITALNALTGALKVGANATDPLHVTTLQQVQAMTSGTAGSVVGVVGGFIGAVQWFNGSRATIPAGWVPADGQLLLRTDYPDLWAAANSGALSSITEASWQNNLNRGAYGLGTVTSGASANFRTPDLNGFQTGSIAALFLRGGNGSAAAIAQIGDVGSIRQQAAPNITGSVGSSGAGFSQGGAGALYASSLTFNGISPNSTANSASNTIAFNANTSNAAYGRVEGGATASEVRPNSVTGIWIIRATNSFAAANTDFTIYNGDTALPASGTLISGGAMYSRYDVNSVTQMLGSVQINKTVGATASVLQFTAFNKGATSAADTTATMNFTSTGNLSVTGAVNSNTLVVTSTAGIQGALTVNGLGTFTGNATVQGALTVNGVGTFTNAVVASAGITSNLSLSANLTYANELNRNGGSISSRVMVAGAERCGFGMYANTAGANRQGIMSVSQDASTNKTWVFSYSDGSLTGQGTYNVASDIRHKSDIKPIQNALDAVCSWNGATYAKKDSDKREVGLFAQDVEKDCPEAITSSRREFQDGTIIEDFKSLNISGVSAAYHTEAIKELAQMVRDLQAEVAKLKAQ